MHAGRKALPGIQPLPPAAPAAGRPARHRPSACTRVSVSAALFQTMMVSHCLHHSGFVQFFVFMQFFVYNL